MTIVENLRRPERVSEMRKIDWRVFGGVVREPHVMRRQKYGERRLKSDPLFIASGLRGRLLSNQLSILRHAERRRGGAGIWGGRD